MLHRTPSWLQFEISIGRHSCSRLGKKGAAGVVTCWRSGGDLRRWHDAINCTSTDACMALIASSSVIPRRFEHSNLGDRGGETCLRERADWEQFSRKNRKYRPTEEGGGTSFLKTVMRDQRRAPNASTGSIVSCVMAVEETRSGIVRIFKLRTSTSRRERRRGLVRSWKVRGFTFLHTAAGICAFPIRAFRFVRARAGQRCQHLAHSRCFRDWTSRDRSDVERRAFACENTIPS